MGMFVRLVISILIIAGIAAPAIAQDCAARTDRFRRAVKLYMDKDTRSAAADSFRVVLRDSICGEYETIEAFQFLGEILCREKRMQEAQQMIFFAIKMDQSFPIDPLVVQSEPLYAEIRRDRFSRLEITSNPPGAIAELDGKYIGRTPDTLEYVSNEKHSILLSPVDERHEPYSGTISVSRDTVMTVHLPVKKVQVHVASKPEQARVYYIVAGRDSFVGTTPHDDLFYWGQVLRIRLESSGYEPYGFQLLAGEDMVSRTIELIPHKGTLNLKYNPKDATVKIDGKESLETIGGRLKTELPIGVHEIMVQAYNYEIGSRRVTIEKGRDSHETMKLKLQSYDFETPMAHGGYPGNLYQSSPVGLGRGYGVNFFGDCSWIEPNHLPPYDSTSTATEKYPIFKFGLGIMGAGNSWLTIGQAFSCLLEMVPVVASGYPYDDLVIDKETKVAVQSQTVLKLTYMQRKHFVGSLGVELDMPIYSDGFFPGYSHPIMILDRGAAKADLKGAASFEVRGDHMRIILGGGYAKYYDDRGTWYQGISTESVYYNAGLSLGQRRRMFLQFFREEFTEFHKDFVGELEMPMMLAVGGAFVFGKAPQFWNTLGIGVSMSLAMDDEDTAFNPTWVYPRYSVYLSVGHARGEKQTW